MSGCRLGNKITPVVMEVKGGEAVHFTLDVRPRRCYSGMHSAKYMAILGGSGSSPGGVQSIFW